MVIPFDFEYAREAVEINSTDVIFKTKSGHCVDLRHFRDPYIYGGDYFVEGFVYWNNSSHKAEYKLWTMEGKLRNDGLETDFDLVIDIIKL